MTKAYQTREQWLAAAVKLLDKEFFAAHPELKLPPYMVAVGWPKGGSKGSHTIGQCFHPEGSADATTSHLFICPTQDDPVRILDILLHERLHSALGHGVGHKGPFKKWATEFGLEGKMTATTASPALVLKLKAINEKLGAYPHVALRMSSGKAKRPGGGGWIRYASTTEDGFKVLVSPKMVEEFGAPKDPWGEQMEPVE